MSRFGGGCAPVQRHSFPPGLLLGPQGGPSSTVPVILPSALGTPQERVLGRECTSELFRQNLSLLKGNPHALLVRMQIGAAAMENCMEVPLKVKNSSSTSGYLSEENENTI